MTDSVLNPSHLKLPTSMSTQRKPVVDLGTRMAHASMALAFLISYVTSEFEYWRLIHVYSGYSLAAVLAFRLVWGWVGASSWVLSAAMLCIYGFCTVAIASGWATYNELLGDGWLNDALQELHEGLGNAAMAVVCIHVGLVVMLRVWRGPQALRPMWRGYANTSGRG